MNCEKIKKSLLTYDLEVSEVQNQLDGHLQSCPDCQKYHKDILAQRVSLLKASEYWEMGPINPEALTFKVMGSIGSLNRSKKWFGIPELKLAFFSRYAIACLSILILAIFISEYNSGTLNSKITEVTKHKKFVLKSAGFTEKAFKSAVKNNTSLYQRIKKIKEQNKNK